MGVATEEPHVVILVLAAHDIAELATINALQVKLGVINAHWLDTRSTSSSLLNDVNILLPYELLCIAHHVG